jgi:hypothetical protein
VTSQREKLQGLIAEIEAMLAKASPKLPWVVSTETAQQRKVLEKVYDYLQSLQQSGETLTGAGDLNLSDDAEASAGAVLHALLQEMQYLRSQLVQPLRSEIASLQQERQALLQEVRQLESRQQPAAPALDQANLDQLFQALSERLERQLRQQIEQGVQRLDAEIVDTQLLSAAAAPTPELGEQLPQLSPAQRLEQLKQVQRQSDELVLNLDKTLRAVFEALQQSVASYQESLSQGLDKMHTLGQQGEMMFNALITHLAQQMSQDGGTYLAAANRGDQLAQLPVSRQADPGAQTSQPEAEASPGLTSGDEDWDALEALNLDLDFEEDEEITLFQLDEELTQLQLDEPEQPPFPVEADLEDVTMIQTGPDTAGSSTADLTDPLRLLEQLDEAAPDPASRVEIPPGEALSAASVAPIEAADDPYQELDELYETLFGEDSPSTDIEATATDEGALADAETAQMAWQADPASEAATAADQISPRLADDSAPDADLAAEDGLEGRNPFGAESEPPALEDSPTLDTLLFDEAVEPTPLEPAAAPLSPAESPAPDSVELAAPEPEAVLDEMFGPDFSQSLMAAEPEEMVADTISSLADLLPEETTPLGLSRADDLSLGLEDFEATEDTFIPAAEDEDLLATDDLTLGAGLGLEVGEATLEQLNADLSRLEAGEELANPEEIEGGQALPEPLGIDLFAEADLESPQPTPQTLPTEFWSTPSDPPLSDWDAESGLGSGVAPDFSSEFSSELPGLEPDPALGAEEPDLLSELLGPEPDVAPGAEEPELAAELGAEPDLDLGAAEPDLLSELLGPEPDVAPGAEAPELAAELGAEPDLDLGAAEPDLLSELLGPEPDLALGGEDPDLASELSNSEPDLTLASEQPDFLAELLGPEPDATLTSEEPELAAEPSSSEPDLALDSGVGADFFLEADPGATLSDFSETFGDLDPGFELTGSEAPTQPLDEGAIAPPDSPFPIPPEPAQDDSQPPIGPGNQNPAAADVLQSIVQELGIEPTATEPPVIGESGLTLGDLLGPSEAAISPTPEATSPPLDESDPGLLGSDLFSDLLAEPPSRSSGESLEGEAALNLADFINDLSLADTPQSDQPEAAAQIDPPEPEAVTAETLFEEEPAAVQRPEPAAASDDEALALDLLDDLDLSLDPTAPPATSAEPAPGSSLTLDDWGADFRAEPASPSPETEPQALPEEGFPEAAPEPAEAPDSQPWVNALSPDDDLSELLDNVASLLEARGTLSLDPEPLPPPAAPDLKPPALDEQTLAEFADDWQLPIDPADPTGPDRSLADPLDAAPAELGQQPFEPAAPESNDRPQPFLEEADFALNLEDLDLFGDDPTETAAPAVERPAEAEEFDLFPADPAAPAREVAPDAEVLDLFGEAATGFEAQSAPEESGGLDLFGEASGFEVQSAPEVEQPAVQEPLDLGTDREFPLDLGDDRFPTDVNGDVDWNNLAALLEDTDVASAPAAERPPATEPAAFQEDLLLGDLDLDAALDQALTDAFLQPEAEQDVPQAQAEGQQTGDSLDWFDPDQRPWPEPDAAAAGAEQLPEKTLGSQAAAGPTLAELMRLVSPDLEDLPLDAETDLTADLMSVDASPQARFAGEAESRLAGLAEAPDLSLEALESLGLIDSDEDLLGLLAAPVGTPAQAGDDSPTADLLDAPPQDEPPAAGFGDIFDRLTEPAEADFADPSSQEIPLAEPVADLPEAGAGAAAPAQDEVSEPGALVPIDGLPEAARAEKPQSAWYLGLDVGATGLSAVLLNQAAGQVYPLYWVDNTVSGVTADKFFRLPMIASLAVAPTGQDSWRLQSVGSSALTVTWDDDDRFEDGENNSVSLLLKNLKPMLKLGIPYQSAAGQEMPQVQWTETVQVPLQAVLASLQALLATLRSTDESPLTVGAVGLEGTAIAEALGQLQGVITSYPANWPDTYSFNLREAILGAGLTQSADQIYFIEDAIAAVLSGLPNPATPPATASAQPLRQQTLYACNWSGGTVVISAGAILTELAVVNLPRPLSRLAYEDFGLHALGYAGDSIDLDIIAHLLHPAERRQGYGGQSYGETAPAEAGWGWQATSDLSQAQWASLGLDELEMPRIAEPDLPLRHRLQQRLESSLLGQSVLEAARHLKLILQHQNQFELKLADQRWLIRRKDLENRVVLPYIQRINSHLNRLMSQGNLTAQGINQVICTGGTASLPSITRWLRQKFPNATIIQDTYPNNRPPSCSRVAYGLVNLVRYPRVLDLTRHQYSDNFLLMELVRTFPDQPMPLTGVLHLLEQRGVNTQACELHLIALLEGRLPPGLVPAASDVPPLSTASLAEEQVRSLSQAPLFTRQNGQIYVPNADQCQQLLAYLAAVLAGKYQQLEEPFFVQLGQVPAE